jgi:hypothetical protein
LNRLNNARRDTDLERLGRMNALSWLSLPELTRLFEILSLANFKRHEVILGEDALATDAHILLTGAANITCLNVRGQRVTVALVAPGPIPDFPLLPVSRWSFQCEAYSDCRGGQPGLGPLRSHQLRIRASSFQEVSSDQPDAMVSPVFARLQFPEPQSS